MSKIWSPTRPVCSPVVFGPGARTVTSRSTGRLVMPVSPPLAGLGSGTARLTDRILLTGGNLTGRWSRPPHNFRRYGHSHGSLVRAGTKAERDVTPKGSTRDARPGPI